MGDTEFHIAQTSECSALISFAEEISERVNQKVRILCDYFEEHSFDGWIECVPYFNSVGIRYNPMRVNHPTPYEAVKAQLEEVLEKLDFDCAYEAHIVEIPVCYGGEAGPDIEHVAQVHQLTVEEVIALHTQGSYLVYMIGFAPGFPYLGGLSEKLHTPRRETPRTAIPAGSVGIAGMQTGVYPIETPGGWQIIGRTPLQLFDWNSEAKTLLKCGDIAKFYPISYAEYQRLKETKSCV